MLEWRDRDGPSDFIPLVDHRNSVVGAWDIMSGSLVEIADYTAQGRLTLRDDLEQVSCVEEGSPGTVCDAPGGMPFAFNSRWRSSKTGLVNMRARWYSPKLGQFTSHDPLGYVDTQNLYAFAAFDPINAWDPYGLEAQSQTSNPAWFVGEMYSGAIHYEDSGSSIIPVVCDLGKCWPGESDHKSEPLFPPKIPNGTESPYGKGHFKNPDAKKQADRAAKKRPQLKKARKTARDRLLIDPDTAARKTQIGAPDDPTDEDLRKAVETANDALESEIDEEIQRAFLTGEPVDHERIVAGALQRVTYVRQKAEIKDDLPLAAAEHYLTAQDNPAVMSLVIPGYDVLKSTVGVPRVSGKPVSEQSRWVSEFAYMGMENAP